MTAAVLESILDSLAANGRADLGDTLLDVLDRAGILPPLTAEEPATDGPVYEWWRHTGGEPYAIRMEHDRITGCVGPYNARGGLPTDVLSKIGYDRPEWRVWAEWAERENAAGHWRMA